jgi:two-component system CheB/CheR fusion protein
MAEQAADHPIVGIGASAGGVEALELLFTHMPYDTGCAFVVVTHLAPDRHSLLPEIITRFTQMPVHVAEAGTVPEPNRVYVLPSDAIMGIERRMLTLRKPSSLKRERKIIDVFFSALAMDIGEQAVGIILSGGDGDGTLGVKAIKERAGLTLAQVADGTKPQHSSMPDSAIASGMIDLPIPVQDMGSHIAEFARGLNTLTSLEGSPREDDQKDLQDAHAEICTILRKQIGHDFSGYKETTFFRRVERRMQVNRVESIGGYLDRLSQDPKEVGALFRDLLINVTNFFRDADAFEVLERLVMPKLFAGRGAQDTVRVWVPGCATGEEVFSIAIIMREYMETLTAVPKVQIFATDIDDAALGVARAGRYPEALMDSVTEVRRKRYFTYDDGSYLVSKDVRDLCVFSPHSVIRDPPFSRLDLISCRNLLIYFGPDVQNQVIPTFHYALRPGGYLFLGTSENVTQFGELFTPLDKKFRVFRSREDAVSGARLPIVISGLRPAPFAQSLPRGLKNLGGTALRHAVEGHVLEHFSPAHVLVNRDGDIAYYSSHTGKYLEAMAGMPTRQLLTMARKGLRLDLRTVLRETVETEQRATRNGVTVETDEGNVQIVNLSAEPLPESSTEERLFLVVFQDVGSALTREQAVQRVSGPDEASAHLERELRETRERLQSLIEEYETALEELKSSNEELVSVNEELQSTNEELEASKEELQSVNEELHTVNSELNIKVDALDRSNTDLANLFESTKVATVFLDHDLIIRSFTPAVSRFFNILPGDRGRPLTDLSGRLTLPTLPEDVRMVLSTGKTHERTVTQDRGNTHYLLRLAPYRNGGQKIEGAVLSFVDVTSLTRAESHQQTLIAELNHRVKNMLAVVIGIAEKTYRNASTPEQFKERFLNRIQALARSYELLSRENWTAANIIDLVRLHIAPFGVDRVGLKSTDITLTPRQALSVGMVIHELATNAAKYGALGAAGRVEVQCRTEENDIVIDWAEHDGPPVEEPSQQGFGLKLVRQEVTYSLHGSCEIRFAPDGLETSLRFPQEDQHGD